MRHGISGNRLGRNSDLRWATVRDLAKATLISQRICTTKAKAKEARRLVDQLITLGKKGTLSSRRRAFAILCDHQLVSDLFNKTSLRFKNRVGGYTRVIPLSTRRGDRAQLAYLELTEKEEVIVSKPKSTATSKKETVLPAPDKEKDIKNEVTPKSAPAKPHPKVEKTIKEKVKTPKNIVGGFKKMFNKKMGGE